MRMAPSSCVFNGEIYNFMDLRTELQAKGHIFKTHCDTEVIIHGYEEYGTALAAKLRGMFAFVVWDTKTERDVRRARYFRHQAVLLYPDRRRRAAVRLRDQEPA